MEKGFGAHPVRQLSGRHIPGTGIEKFLLLINFDDPETKGALVGVVESCLSRTRRSTAHRAMRFLYDVGRWENANGIGNDDQYEYLDIAIKGSLSYSAILDYKWTDVSGWKLRKAHGKITVSMRMFRVEVVDATSKLIWNTVGYIQLRPGVQINTLRHFMNIDDLAVIRPFNLTREQKRAYLVKAFQQIGKEYDFNSDIDCHDRRLLVGKKTGPVTCAGWGCRTA